MMGILHRVMRIVAWAAGWLPIWLLLAPLLAAAGAADAVHAVQVLREGGCGGIVPAAQPLRRDALLDRAAALWARGGAAAAAVRASGYAALTLSSVHATADDAALLALLRHTQCRTLSDRSLRDLGVYQRGVQTWLILAARETSTPPAGAAAGAVSGRTTAPGPGANGKGPAMTGPALAARTLSLVNAVRAHGARCGDRSFGPAPPVKLSGILSEVALGHAADMARHDYFEHEDLAGRSPADRVRAVGYAEKLVGENIAYGPESADEVVKGWLDSPGHCENIMDPRFAEMGIANSPGRLSRRGLYWVQLLVAPKA